MIFGNNTVIITMKFSGPLECFCCTKLMKEDGQTAAILTSQN